MITVQISKSEAVSFYQVQIAVYK